MATAMAPVASRDVFRCDYCSLVQFRATNALCRRCHKPLEVEEPKPLPTPTEIAPRVQAAPQSGSAVAVRIREIRSQRCLSQRQLAARMEVPRTYISKVENGRALPTLASLERLAVALSVHLGDLVQDNYSQRQQEITSLMSDPFVSEISLWVPKLDALQRSAVLNHLREMASGQRKTA